MFIDFWYGHTKKDIARVNCCFYPNSGEYRGNIYAASGECIGDFVSRDSVEVERHFPGIFGA